MILAAVLGLAFLAGCRAGGAPSAVPLDADGAAALALAENPTAFAGISARDLTLVGQGSWYEVTPKGEGWLVVVRVGWGDCPAGCIHEHRWTYAVDPAGAVTLQQESGEPVPADAPVTGLVSAGPTCPVMQNPPASGCEDRAVAGATIVINDADGVEVARVASGSDGRFSVQLAPGSYRFVPQPVDGLLGVAEPLDVVIEKGDPPTELTFSYDTGIR